MSRPIRRRRAAPLRRAAANDSGRVRVLLVHDRFPGQFTHLAADLASDPQIDLRFVAGRADGAVPGLAPALYQPSRPVHADTHPYLRAMERAVLNGQAAYRRLAQLKAQGFEPDLAYFHSGFGPGLYLRDLFPSARLIGYFEWYYHGMGGDAAFLTNGRLDDDARCRLRTRNADILLELMAVDRAMTPTLFQRDQFPPALRGQFTVLHDGVDTAFFAPGEVASPRLAALGLDRPGPVVTYATRGMEPYRGFPQFMKAADLLLRRHPDLRIVVAGSDQVAYSGRPTDGQGSYLEQALAAHPDLDRNRLILPGRLDIADYRNLLRRSTVHTYLTVPFVLSWSLIEAMATGCALVASDTVPVREAVSPGVEALLVDFFDWEALASNISDLLSDPARRESLGQQARTRAIARYDLASLLPQQRAALGLPLRSPVSGRRSADDASNFKSLWKGKVSNQND
jgi:glycosyltransferase involved in cell wall biosynthesis